MTLDISNREARWLWLSGQRLADTPTGRFDLGNIIHDLGFVQIDSIRNVTRAHHHILWSRNQTYREPMIWDHMSKDRAVFEHFTHDASLIPMAFYPYWSRQFRRLGRKVESYKYFSSITHADLETVMSRIVQDGPLCTRAFTSHEARGTEMWARPTHKRALDYLWYKGDLSTCHRENFVKFYDLSERIIPVAFQQEIGTDEEQIDWLCHAALSRLAFGTLNDIAKFWEAVSLQEVKAWAERHRHDLIPVRVCSAGGDWKDVYTLLDIESRLTHLSKPTSRLRIINPFDPAVRDRNRLKFLFGFDYKNEIFVPAAKRQWGYYVYPVLEGDRFIGRVELSANRKGGVLNVKNLWMESKVKWTKNRSEKLSQELSRLTAFIGLSDIVWECDHPP